MVAVRVSRIVAEVLGETPVTATVTTVDTSALVDLDAAEGPVRVSRIVVEVLGGLETPVPAVTTLDTEALIDLDAAEGPVLVSRIVAEVLGVPQTTPAVTSLDTSALVSLDAAEGAVRVSRIVAEIMSPNYNLGAVVPLAERLYAPFLHNWRENLVVRSAYLTAINTDPYTGKRRKRALRIRPARAMDVTWTETDRLVMEQWDRFLEEVSDGHWQIPLYCDQAILRTDHLAADTVLSTPGESPMRIHTGTRIMVYRPDGTATTHLVAFANIDSVTLTAALGTDAPVGSLVWPVLDVLADFDMGANWIRRHTAEGSFTALEIPGESCQRPTWPPDVPPGPRGPGDLPIWDWQVNWREGARRRYVREGYIGIQGRGLRAQPDGPRSIVTLEQDILADGYLEIRKLVRFFDAMRGMEGSFWTLDTENVLTIQDIAADGTTITILAEGLDAPDQTGYIGLEHPDVPYGMAVAEILGASPVSGTWVLNLATPYVPAGLDWQRTIRVCRARLAEFGSDELTETYHTDGVVEATIPIHEILP
jgi:hypothetical protein